MANSRICETSGCGIEIQPITNNGETIWDCPSCAWKLKIEIKEEE